MSDEQQSHMSAEMSTEHAIEQHAPLPISPLLNPSPPASPQQRFNGTPSSPHLKPSSSPPHHPKPAPAFIHSIPAPTPMNIRCHDNASPARDSYIFFGIVFFVKGFELRYCTTYFFIREGTWTRGEVIGNGAFGTVYKALDNSSGSLFAVKQVPLQAFDARNGNAALQNLVTEIELLQELVHSNIVRYFGCEISSDTMSIFLE
jgi:hypothetical protein